MASFIHQKKTFLHLRQSVTIWQVAYEVFKCRFLDATSSLKAKVCPSICLCVHWSGRSVKIRTSDQCLSFPTIFCHFWPIFAILAVFGLYSFKALFLRTVGLLVWLVVTTSYGMGKGRASSDNHLTLPQGNGSHR